MSLPNTITIAGAGPSGLSAAIILAQAGRRVRVFEQHATVGARFNDDYQGLENWSRDEDALREVRGMGLDVTWWSRTFHSGTLYDPKFRPIGLSSTRPLFYMVRRGSRHPRSLDRALLAQALDLGVDVTFNQRAAGTDIVATGPRGRPMAIARGITFPTDLPDTACAVLHDDLAPDGYAYFLASDGQATLATVLFTRFEEVHQCFERSCNALRRLLKLGEMRHGKAWGGYGLFSVPSSCRDGRAIRVGEAAGFQDLLFGFGIRSALVSGKLAAQSIIEQRDYDELWRERLLPHLKASVVARAVYEVWGGMAKRGLWHVLGTSASPMGVMHRLYNLTPVHRVLYPFVRARASWRPEMARASASGAEAS